MANGKKSFIAYCDWIETFDELEDDEAGRLVKHLFRYVNDQDPEAPDRLTKMLFIDLRRALKRDLKKYEGYIEKQRENGAKGGRPKKTQKTQAFISKPKKADSVNVTDSVNDTVTVNDIKEIVYYLNGALGSKYKHSTETTKASIQARFNQGFTVEDFKQVIDIKVKDWGSRPDMVQFLRPQTLFGTKFESYLNQVEATESREEQLDVELLKHLKNVRSTSNNSKPSVFSRVSTIPEVGTGKATD